MTRATGSTSQSSSAPSASASPSRRAAQDRPPAPAGRSPASPRASSRSSASASTTSSKSRPPRKGSVPRSTRASCAVCHNVPAIGGGGLILEVRAGYRDESGAFKTFDPSGETLMHLFSTPTHGCQPGIPSQATIIARRAPIPLFGAGLVEAIPTTTLIRALRGSDRPRPRRHQRARRDHPRRRDRRDARRPLRMEGAARHAAVVRRRRLPQRDGHHQRSVPDRGRVRHPPRADPIAAIRCRTPRTRSIAGPAAAASTTSRRSCASSRRCRVPMPDRRARRASGSSSDIGCASCHVPVLQTGTNREPAFNRQSVRAVLGSAAARRRTGDGIPQGAADRPGDQDAGAVGAALPPAAAARR